VCSDAPYRREILLISLALTAMVSYLQLRATTVVALLVADGGITSTSASTGVSARHALASVEITARRSLPCDLGLLFLNSIFFSSPSVSRHMIARS
jgi:hypothetical protein